jgi:hypothetical protein
MVERIEVDKQNNTESIKNEVLNNGSVSNLALVVEPIITNLLCIGRLYYRIQIQQY